MGDAYAATAPLAIRTSNSNHRRWFRHRRPRCLRRVTRRNYPGVTAVDFDPVFVADVKARMCARWDFACIEHDMRVERFGCFDALYALDVLEHIDKTDEAA